jgi:beta-glucosidase-like glycosyl hydrolase
VEDPSHRVEAARLSVQGALRELREAQAAEALAAQGGAGSEEAQVAKTLATLTLSEKAAQLDIFRACDMLTNGVVNMSKATANWGAAYGADVSPGTMHDVYPYPEIANEMMQAMLDVSRAKVPPLFGAEATHGLQMDDHTIFPSPIGLAATFDKTLMRQYGETVASETRAAGLHVAWAPVLGLCQDPRWGRCEEMMGEDPHLAGELGRAAVTGLTASGKFNSTSAVAPLVKHYAAYRSAAWSMPPPPPPTSRASH